MLEIGNFLNEGSNRGGSMGFKLSSLEKLSATKSVDDTMTLLDFIVGIIMNSQPEILELYNELPHVTEASKTSVSFIKKDISQWKANSKLTEDFIAAVNETEDLPHVRKFAQDVKLWFSKFENEFSTMEGSVGNLCQYLGEDSGQPPEEIFLPLSKFLKSFEVRCYLPQIFADTI